MKSNSMSMHDKAVTMIDTRDHSMDLSSELANVQSLDKDGIVLDVSPGWLKMTGYSREDIIGHSFREILLDETLGQVKNEFPHLKDYGFVNNVPLKIRRKDGTIIEAVLNGTSKYDNDGYFVKTFCELKNLTYYMNSREAVSGILAMEKFLRMVMNLKSNITMLYQYIMDEGYMTHRLFDDLSVILNEPSEIEQAMLITGDVSGDQESVRAKDYFMHFRKDFPMKPLVIANAADYYDSASPDYADKSVGIMSVSEQHEPDTILVFIQFRNVNVSCREWSEALSEIRGQIEPLIVLVKTMKEIEKVEEALEEFK